MRTTYRSVALAFLSLFLNATTAVAGTSAALEQISPAPTEYPPDDTSGFFVMHYSWYGDVKAEVQPVANLGCDPADFTGFVPGRIALIKRGVCTFFLKASNAELAGASAVIVFNSGAPQQTDAFRGTLGSTGVTIPVVGASFAIGDDLFTLAQSQPVVLRLAVLPPTFERVSPSATTFPANDPSGFFTMTYSPAGDVTGNVQAVPSLGCDTGDFGGFVPGNVALIRRGVCTFFQKASNAEAAGASAVIVSNSGLPGQTDAVRGTLGGLGIHIPVIGASTAIGDELASLAQTQEVLLHLAVVLPAFEQANPLAKAYAPTSLNGFFTLQYSGYGHVMAEVQPVANLGCDTADFTGLVPGNIALIKRGACAFALKASNAELAGASGVIVYNSGVSGQTDAFRGTLGGPGVNVPVVGTSTAIGEELLVAAQSQPAIVHLAVFPPTFSQAVPLSKVYAPNAPAGFYPLQYSVAGNTVALVQAAADLGCAPPDFTGFSPGNIALIKRGVCTFFTKAANAEAAGASGVIIYNSGNPEQTEALRGTLGGPGVTIPVIGTSFAIGSQLLNAAQANNVVAEIALDTSIWAIEKVADQAELTLATGQSFPVTYTISVSPTTKGTIDPCVDVSDTRVGDLGQVCSEGVFEYAATVGPYDACGEYSADNTASFLTDDTKTTGSASWNVVVHVPCDGCTLTQGYWKTHSQYGPARYDDNWSQLGEDTPFYLSGKSWYQVLWTPPVVGNTYYALARQYIAAKLNILNGASSNAAVDAAILWAETGFFATYTPYSNVLGNVRKAALTYATLFDRYNNGYVGPGHCSE